MSEMLTKRFEEPDEIIELPHLEGQIVVLGDVYVGRFVHKPGFHWGTDIRPLVGTPICQFQHQGIVISGAIRVTTAGGAQRTLEAGMVFDIPPGHDARVIGDEPCVTIEFRGARDWARPATSGERVLATTILFTDIVGSTTLAARLGDRSWKALLARHSDRVRQALDLYRGVEIRSTGDGFLAIFDGAARAAHCAEMICLTAPEDGIQVRAGIHTGEIERYPNEIVGVAVHATARIAALAGPGQVLVSGSTVGLLEGAGLVFEDAGEHELKGLEGLRRVYRLVSEQLEAQALELA
jgi:class 3 adenylate cyclase